MKKKLILLSFLVGLFGFAQNDILFHVTSGATFSNIRGNDTAELNKYDFNYVGGLGIEVPINTKFSFVTGVNYDNKSFKNEIDFDRPTLFDPIDPAFSTEKRKIKLTLQYLSIPVLFRYFIDNKNSFFINSGPFLGVFLNSKTRIDGDKIEDESNDLFKTLDLGWSFGIGKKVKISENNTINVELRNNLGLTNISDIPIRGNGTVKTNSVNLLLSYDLKLK